MNERKARALIERHFVEALPEAKLRKLQEHLQGCEACRAYHDRLFGFEAGYDGGRGEVERIGQEVFERLEQPERKGLLDGIFAFTWPFPTVMAGAAAALALAIFARSPSTGPDDGFATRGGPQVQTESGPQLLAACFVDAGKGPEAPRNLTSEAPFPSCPRGGRLALAYRGARAGDTLVVFAVRGGEPTLLVPTSGAMPAALESGAGTRALRGSFAIAADAAAGEVSLVAVFGRGLDAARLQAAVAAGEDVASAAGEDAIVRRLSYRLDPQ